MARTFSKWLRQSDAGEPFRAMMEAVDRVADPVAKRVAFNGAYRAAEAAYSRDKFPRGRAIPLDDRKENER